MTAVHEPRRMNWGFVAGTVVVIGLGVMWFYGLVLAPKGNPDRLEDPTFEVAARTACANSRERLAALPQAADATDPASRADILDDATDELVDMVDELSSLRVGTEQDLFLINSFLSDWDLYIDDRYRHADRLRDEGDVRFTVTVQDGKQQGVDEILNGFTRVNDIEDCAPPGDLA